MKEDKFLLGIIIGIVLLVAAAITVVLLRSPANAAYIADDAPAGVVHNYFLALQRQDYDKAYSYLAADLKADLSLDQFIREIDYGVREADETTLQLGETGYYDENRSQVEIILTNYRDTNLLFFGSRSSQPRHYTVHLKQEPPGSNWRLIQFPQPYWGYQWGQDRE